MFLKAGQDPPLRMLNIFDLDRGGRIAIRPYSAIVVDR